MNTHAHVLSGAYPLDAVDDLERAAFERHLATCAACRVEVAGFRSTTLQLSLLIGATPPQGLRQQVLDGISMVRPLPPRVTRRAGRRIDVQVRQMRFRWLAAAAAVVAFGGGTGAALHSWDRQTQTQTQTQMSLADRVIQAPDAQRFQQAVATGGNATLVRSRSLGKGVLMTRNLAAAPAGKVYQLWLRPAGGSFVSAGLLPTGADQSVVLDGDVGTAVGAGLSLEPAGGSSRPTTPVAMIASPDRIGALPPGPPVRRPAFGRRAAPNVRIGQVSG